MRQSEVKESTLVQLQEEFIKSQKAYSDLRMAHAMTPLENPLELRRVRRTIARIATELTKRELNS